MTMFIHANRQLCRIEVTNNAISNVIQEPPGEDDGTTT